MKYASELNDVDELSITKLDVLGTFKEISISDIVHEFVFRFAKIHDPSCQNNNCDHDG